MKRWTWLVLGGGTLVVVGFALFQLNAADVIDLGAPDECRWSYECPGRGGMDIRFTLETCDPDGRCSSRDLNADEFIGVVSPDQDCTRPKECRTGAVPDALRGEGWSVGRWKVVAPLLKGLEQPEPMIVEVFESELTPVTLTYSR